MNLESAESTWPLRLAETRDASAIAAVLLAAFAEFKRLYTPDAFAATTPGAEEIKTRMDEGPVWVVRRNDLIVGTASALRKDAGLYLRGMAVLPAARGQAIGHGLLSETERYATAHDCRRLFLSTTPFLSGAIRLYEQFGFSRSNEGPHDLFGTPLFII